MRTSFTLWLHTKRFLAELVTDYDKRNKALAATNTELRRKLGAKDEVLQRALDDNAQSLSFHQQVIANLHKELNELKKGV